MMLKTLTCFSVGVTVCFVSWLGPFEQEQEPRASDQKSKSSELKQTQPEKVEIGTIENFPMVVGGCSMTLSCIGSKENVDGKVVDATIATDLDSDLLLGIKVRRPSGTLRKHLKLGPMMGLLILGVGTKSVAESAGLEVDDVLVSLEDQMLLNSDQLSGLFLNRKPNDVVVLRIIRRGEPMKIELKIPKKMARRVKKVQQPLVPVLRTLKHPKMVGSAKCSDCHVSSSQLKTVQK